MDECWPPNPDDRAERRNATNGERVVHGITGHIRDPRIKIT
jgi:hypothetical protein